jgi:hypothetical protein
MNYISKNIFKILYYLIITSIFLFPLFFYISYNDISKETYQKKYYLVKAKAPQFLIKANMQDQPIINTNSLKAFAKESILKIFNYEVSFAEQKLKGNKAFFSNVSYSGFKELFLYRANDEEEGGIVIKEAMINDGPYYLGSFEYLNKKAWKFYMNITETHKGLSGKTEYRDKKIFMIIIEDDFNKNGKGLSIDSLEIK